MNRAGAPGPDVVGEDRDDRAAALAARSCTGRPRASSRSCRSSTMPITAFQPLGDSSSARQMKLPAALLTRMSSAPKCLTVRSTISSTCSGLRTSSCTASASMPDVAERAPALLEVLGLPAGDRDPRAERPEAPRDREADAGAAAGDDRDADPAAGMCVEHCRLIIDVKIAACRAHVLRCVGSRWRVGVAVAGCSGGVDVERGAANGVCRAATCARLPRRAHEPAPSGSDIDARQRRSGCSRLRSRDADIPPLPVVPFAAARPMEIVRAVYVFAAQASGSAAATCRASAAARSRGHQAQRRLLRHGARRAGHGRPRGSRTAWLSDLPRRRA